MPPFLRGRPRPLVIGHRGAPLAAPENSLASFEAALRAGADAVECDARLSRDGAVLLHHDETLDRTTDGTGRVAEKRREELRALRLRGGGERIPLLSELLDLCRGRLGVLVEAKVDRPGEAFPLVDAILGEISPIGPKGEVAVISFSSEAVRRVAERAPGVPRGITFETPFEAKVPLALAADVVTVERALIGLPALAEVAAAGVEIFAYSLDTEEDRRAARAAGVTGWITNLPDRREA
ncbi:MAG TPA: glycerophosphodiester phosphodiesterase [Planctomycetota bacterium]|jgi:glycerophosphoryl diester phosphodiesterase|nr:glycerophosphodiester phosphodiesterase [Planctomycetota bacterium]